MTRLLQRAWLLAVFFATALSWPAGAAQLYSIGEPTGEEQLYLEYINRARTNPAAEGARLATTTDPDVRRAIEFFGIDTLLFTAQMDALPPLPPVAFNAKLLAAARAHTADMLAHAYQDHIGTDGSTAPSRMAAQGYNVSAYGENVYSYSRSVFYGHAAFEIDWGGLPENGGMLNPPIHRLITHTPYFREIGVGVLDGSNGGVGPQLVTEDFALAADGNNPFLTGVVYADTNGNGFYDPGEGIGGVTVAVAGVEFYAITAASGGYSVPLPNDGAFPVTFSGGGLPTLQKVATVVAGQNVKVDYVAATGPGELVNISTRVNVGTGENALIGGFILTGTAPKKIIVRSLGPSLPLEGALQNPTLELHDSAGQLIATNDDWQTNANKEEIVASTVAPPHPNEPALLLSLPANGSAYTAVVRGVNNATGLGLVEVYDLDRAAAAQLANLSTRGLVETGDNVMIGGFILAGATPANVIVRALGPSLDLAGALADPTLELVNGDGVSLGTNDNWRSDQEEAILASTLPPRNDAEAAFVATLVPGAYTAIVRGAHESNGIALVEVYHLP